MAAASYSFLDIAVLDAVRERFAVGEALVILSTDLNEILWANGAGAQWIGYDDIEAAIGSTPQLPAVALRQISATSGYPNIGHDRHIALRLPSGLKSRIVDLHASAIVLPRGENALLLALGAQDAGENQEQARRIVEGFSEPGHFAALIDREGKAAAATEGFSALGISEATLKGLVLDVGIEQDRLVKRHIKGKRRFPAGIARLADDPPLHLLLVVDEGETEAEAPKVDEDIRPEEAFDTVADEQQPAPADVQGVEVDTADDEPAVEAETPSGGDIEQEPAEVAAKDRPEPQTVRFAWRTDAEGRFSAVSQEFVDAVGETSGNVVGRTFRDVSDAFALDPEGAIARLMERRDTWSGRTVMWPLAGTQFRIPVDLAALPAYGRGHIFEGFRGFGVARLGEAVEVSETPPADTQDNEPAAGLPPSDDGEPDEGGKADEPASEAETDPFMGEGPALQITESPKRRASDKIIRLAEHRETAQDTGLTVSERTAFREIGERLRRANEILASREEEESGSESPDTTETVDPAAAAPAQDNDQAFDPAERAETQEETSDADREDTERPAEPIGEVEEPVAPYPPPPAPAETADHTNLLSKLPLPILIHSGDQLHYANREFLRLTGYADLEALAAAGGIGALFHDREEALSDDEVPEALRLCTAQGEMLPVEAHLQTVPWEHGNALMLALRAAQENEPDQENRQEPERTQALETQLDEMRTIVDTATDGIVVIKGDGTIQSINRPAEALFGFDAVHVTDKPFSSLFAIESQRTVQDYLTALADNGVASVLNDGRQVIGREAQGRFIPLFITIGRLPNSGGYCAVLRDITSWKRAEEELTHARAQAERASAQKSEFLARVSHEIRTPLNAIIGFSELMIDEKFGPIGGDRYRDYLRDINRSGNHVLDLVNDLLDISKIEAGQQEMQYEAVSLNETLGQVVAMMQPQANGERVIIRSSFASRVPEVVADLRTVRQIAFNLLSNAVRYTPAGGQVIVSTAYSPDGSVALRVRDTGVGMSSAELDEALKPFKQINALRRKSNGGTGLGLPLTRAMVEANRAQFFINSTPGDGTLVEVTFPPTRVLAE